jgi:hypothetical protein
VKHRIDTISQLRYGDWVSSYPPVKADTESVLATEVNLNKRSPFIDIYRKKRSRSINLALALNLSHLRRKKWCASPHHNRCAFFVMCMRYNFAPYDECHEDFLCIASIRVSVFIAMSNSNTLWMNVTRTSCVALFYSRYCSQFRCIAMCYFNTSWMNVTRNSRCRFFPLSSLMKVFCLTKNPIGSFVAK